MPLRGACCPLYITDRDEVQSVVLAWKLRKVRPFRLNLSLAGSRNSTGFRGKACSWSVQINKMLGRSKVVRPMVLSISKQVS